VPHKTEGVHCPGCPHYQPVTKRMLIVKLDAMGDVLRTTCMLPGLTEVYGKTQLTWITAGASVPLLKENEYVQRVLTYGPEAFAVLQVEAFDVVINLDASPKAATLATLAQAPQKVGYLMHKQGYVYPATPSAVRWLKMGLFDDLKKANTETYQALMCEILGTDPARCRYVLRLTEKEREWARNWAAEQRLGAEAGGRRPIVGFNTGAGGRWEYKRWRREGYGELAWRVHRELGGQVLLLGGDEELEYNRQLLTVCPPGTVTSGAHAVRNFAALVGLCDAVVTGDTLAMHMALALERPTVVLFGPTSVAEIEMFGRGTKIAPEMDCLVCYKETCDFKPACMDLIAVDQVFKALVPLVG
jgi:ADP-heptose:LPS heptosyltransferase